MFTAEEERMKARDDALAFMVEGASGAGLQEGGCRRLLGPQSSTLLLTTGRERASVDSKVAVSASTS